LVLSISWRCYSELKALGCEDILKKAYGEYITSPQSGYDFSLKYDLNKIPSNKGSFFFTFLPSSSLFEF